MDLSSIENKIIKCEEEITNLINKIDNTMENLQEKKETISINSLAKNNLEVLNSKNFIKLNYSSSTFNVIDTPNISVLNLVNFIKKYKLYQTAQPGYDNSCLGVAKAYGRSLMTGRLPRNMNDFYGGAYTYFDNGTSSTNKNEILKIIYDQLVQGKPCVLEVTTKKGNRHFATVVGMKETVTNSSELKEEDLLIIDARDGKLEAMDNSKTADRHMRKDYRNRYRVDVLKI